MWAVCSTTVFAWGSMKSQHLPFLLRGGVAMVVFVAGEKPFCHGVCATSGGLVWGGRHYCAMLNNPRLIALCVMCVVRDHQSSYIGYVFILLMWHSYVHIVLV